MVANIITQLDAFVSHSQFAGLSKGNQDQQQQVADSQAQAATLAAQGQQMALMQQMAMQQGGAMHQGGAMLPMSPQPPPFPFPAAAATAVPESAAPQRVAVEDPPPQVPYFSMTPHPTQPQQTSSGPAPAAHQQPAAVGGPHQPSRLSRASGAGQALGEGAPPRVLQADLSI